MAQPSKSRTMLLIASAAASLSILPASAALAAGGGGGGGGSPSQSAPSYDPAEEYRKGVEALNAEEFGKAQKAFKRVIRVAPKDANTQYLLGASYMGAGNFKRARKPLQAALKYAPDMVLARRDLAITFSKIDKMSEARKILVGLQTMQAECGESCAQKTQIAQALTAVQSAIDGLAQSSFGPDLNALANASAADALYSGAVGLINEGQYERALASLDKAALAFGPHPDVLTYQGFANRKLARYDVAEGYYNRALAIAPTHLGALEYYGELKLERGDMAGAKNHLAQLQTLCAFGCYEADELGRWIAQASEAAEAKMAIKTSPSA